MIKRSFINKSFILSIIIILLFTVAGCSDSSTVNSQNKSNQRTTQSSVSKSVAGTSQIKDSGNSATVSPIKLQKAKVTHHTDGDTIGVTLESGQYEKVRFIGVNTPESTTKHEEYGEQASNYTKSQLYGKTVYLESDAGITDKYGRLLRYIWISPPTTINESEIRSKMFNAILAVNGYAEQMTIQPNVKYADYFRKFCAEARENKRGLWAVNPNGTTKGDGISAPSSSSSSSYQSTSSSNSESYTTGSASSSGSSNNSTSESSSTLNSSENGRIKGNINSKGEKIYHLPGDPYYNRTKAEAYFDTEAQAQAAGYRPIQK
ncbi:thermonuclease family protein [Clostridium tyrobutyricum]|uniref:thermonuclease family protein n=1 Tax=Clostridium tyrobutyricum TaxID=1519 RepID=UPI001C387731|nr:thermonuclease family protein [Clostridium tyrobutyricum]MBV4420054.1 thermonuclease family protein [Clostridium tyrobutyricum]